MKKKLFGFVAMLLTLGTLGGLSLAKANDSFKEDSAYATASDVWSICGTINGWNPSDKTYDMQHTSDDASGNYIWTIKITFKADDQWKIVKNHAWGGDIGWSDYSTDQGKGTYLTNSGGNFKVKQAGDYIVTFTDKSVKNSSYGPWAGDVKIEPYTETKYQVTYHVDTEVVQEFSQNEVWNSYFVEKEGYRLEGWYTDSSLKNEFVKGSKVTSNLDLYPKYTEAKDFRILVSEHWFGASSSGDHSMSVYLWRDTLEGGNNTWPGEAIDLNTKFDNYYVFTIDASQSYSKLIISNDKLQNDPRQTVDLSLDNYDDLSVYNIGDLNTDENKYNAACAGVNEISLAYKIYELAGDFIDNEDETEITTNCHSNYETAKKMFLSLSADAKENFQNFNDGELLLAKTTYEHWCEVNNDNSPYAGEVKGANVALSFVNDNYAYIIVFVAISAIAVVGLVLLKKKRALN